MFTSFHFLEERPIRAACVEPRHQITIEEPVACYTGDPVTFTFAHALAFDKFPYSHDSSSTHERSSSGDDVLASPLLLRGARGWNFRVIVQWIVTRRRLGIGMVRSLLGTGYLLKERLSEVL